LEIFFGKVFFIAFFISKVSFTVVVNVRDRGVGNVLMPSSIYIWLREYRIGELLAEVLNLI
jgi:hypothetical protein